MSDSPPQPSKGLLARGLKLVGRLTGPETRSGRAFGKVERGLTRLAARLAESPTWLRISGEMMRGSLNLRIRRNALLEEVLRELRLPAASEVQAMRAHLRRMNDQIEALGSQLELVVDLLERQERAQPRSEGSREEPRPEESVPHRHSA